MRPSSIIAFERIVLISLGLGVLNSFVSWDRVMARLQPGTGDAFAITMLALVTAIYLLLLWFVSRRGSVVAKWIYVVLVAFSIPSAFIFPPPALSYGPVPAAITIVQYLLAATSLWFLFRPDARRWFRKEAGVDPEIFR